MRKTYGSNNLTWVVCCWPLYANDYKLLPADANSFSTISCRLHHSIFNGNISDSVDVYKEYGDILGMRNSLSVDGAANTIAAKDCAECG
jgi:hypothetical protein